MPGEGFHNWLVPPLLGLTQLVALIGMLIAVFPH
jgi:hypothetical protein